MPQALAFLDPSLSTKNTGDLFIADSVRRILRFDEAASIRVDPRKLVSEADIERINQTEAAVIVGTNLWYRKLEHPGRWMFTADQLRRIRVPIIPLGVGTTRHGQEDSGFEPGSIEQLRLIHESCPVASARDPRTLEELSAAGITNVRMTGCPTMFRALTPEWRLRRKDSKRVVATVRHGQKQNVRRLLKRLEEVGLEPVVAAQQEKDNFTRKAVPLVRKAYPTVYEYDVRPYFRLVEEAIGAIGWRLHGNMIHLAHGNPAILLANCSRGESFCEAFDLPVIRCPDHHKLSEREIARHVEQLLDPATFAKFPARYAEHRAAMAEFLEANGLEHNLMPSTGRPASPRAVGAEAAAVAKA